LSRPTCTMPFWNLLPEKLYQLLPAGRLDVQSNVN